VDWKCRSPAGIHRRDHGLGCRLSLPLSHRLSTQCELVTAESEEALRCQVGLIHCSRKVRVTTSPKSDQEGLETSLKRSVLPS
jgi:hypothetical protein